MSGLRYCSAKTLLEAGPFISTLKHHYPDSDLRFPDTRLLDKHNGPQLARRRLCGLCVYVHSPVMQITDRDLRFAGY
jgi:hypothetical protein